ncbi:tRNA uridine(34) 5-carboxymethylaminomethyl modification radical SAM/GNAT enzyme Elp3 [Candidatus Woesearchaeota archaeon]|nr:tRNA uridine(34) 5-carboxymethylaminomethyl modification radical SAM/GNAT enzyme Elp3 [Candidatus Woesearchaeota archaeon]
MPRDFYSELARELKQKKLGKDEATRVKIKLTQKYGMGKIPNDIEVFLNLPEPEAKQLQQQLRIKPVRTISGIASISLMTKPYGCPHGRCTFCPGGPNSAFGDVPQSYTGKEPATMRAIRAGFDPYLQVFSRLEQYAVTGQSFDKVELIIQGGTFPWLPQDYKEEFVGHVFKAMNDFSKEFFGKGSDEIDLRHYKEFFEMPGEFKNEERVKRVTERMLQLKKGNGYDSKKETTAEFLLRQQKINETAKVRCIGLTIETKPDWGKAPHGNHMLKLGCTRVELGIESVYEQQLKLTNRGHTINDTKESLQQLKDLGLKINAHYMLGLPGSTKESDLEGLKELFSNPDFRPDMLKIYPCLVIKGTPLYLQWQKGQFTPITTAEAAEVISEFKRFVPKWCRIMRVNRDIPTYVTSAGIDRTNLRQYVQQLQKQKGIICNCIRCREIGRKGWSDKGTAAQFREERNAQSGSPRFAPLSTLTDKSTITVTEYEGSGGKEFFIAAEDPVNDAIIGFCRMRFPTQQLRSEITPTTAIIRELHVYATAVAIGNEPDEKTKLQHRGFGRKLMAAAEKIAKENGMDKMLVISGVGAKEYYKKLWYGYDGPYMGKKLQ